jgi:nicotinamide mononucleotide adenylyltransferase
MGPDDAYKNKIGERLTQRLADAVEKEEITISEASSIARYILENIEKTQNNAELVSFIEKLAQNWPIFSSILTMEQNDVMEEKAQEAEAVEQKEEAAVEEISQLLKENKIDEAAEAAKSASDIIDQNINTNG